MLSFTAILLTYLSSAAVIPGHIRAQTGDILHWIEFNPLEMLQSQDLQDGLSELTEFFGDQ